FNNAGLLTDQAYYSEQGNEMQFEVNALAPYLLTKALTPILAKAETPFVVSTATSNLHSQKDIDIAELKRPTKFVKLMGSYVKSKAALVALMNALAKEFPNLRIVSVDPGSNKTKMTKGSGMPKWLLPIRNLFFQSADKGARLIYQVAFNQEFQSQSGIYVSGGKVKEMKVALTQAEIDQMIS
ncbi:MAG: short-chain dehydrogenase, partial [Bacteroidota bacterium]